MIIVAILKHINGLIMRFNDLINKIVYSLKACQMKRLLHYAVAILVAISIPFASTMAQGTVTVTGVVTNSKTGESVSAVSISVKNGTAGTYTDDRGHFKLTAALQLPFTLVVSSIGYASQEVQVTQNNQALTISFAPGYVLGEEVVVAASRVAERLLETPVSIERVNTTTIRNAPAASYYDIIGNLKGVDMTTSSLTFKTISTRGFNGSGNLRFNQLVDGMDNQAPGLNFSVGNIIGLTELDVDNMELLPGASSALYGSGGMNGTLLITSKNPFKYQGFSAQVKEGVMHVGDPQQKPTLYHDITMRWAYKINDKWAFKIGGQYIKADDWRATDRRNLSRNNVLSNVKPGNRQTDPNYDGVNVFGDEVSTSMQALALSARSQVAAMPGGTAGLGYIDQQIGLGRTPYQIQQQMTTGGVANPLYGLSPYLPFLIPTSTVANNPYANAFGGFSASRTGYDEQDLVDYNAYNVKLSAALHYKVSANTEASLSANWGSGTTVYTGADRYSLKNLQMGQYKLEFRNNNWFLRAYTIQENSGDSYTANTAAIAMNRSWKGDADWLTQFTNVYGAAKLGILSPANTTPLVVSDAQANQVARGVADMGMYPVGSAAFKHALDSVAGVSISNGGAKFADKSAMYHAEGQYNLTQYVKFVDVLVGASYRKYVLNSKGTIFADTSGTIGISEYGGYVQLQKPLLNDVLKLTGSIRFDKNENFKARFTPRFTGLIKVAKDNNIRLSYQTAYRFPSTQDQWINLQIPSAKLIGGLPIFNTVYGFDAAPVYTAESITNFRNNFAATGNVNPALLQQGKFVPVKPESMQSYELGYRGVLAKKLLIDVYGYYSRYKDFIARVAVGRGKSRSTNPAVNYPELLSVVTTDNYSFVYNVEQPVKAYGWGAGLVYNIYKEFNISGNVYSDKLSDVPPGVVTYFNTPKIRYNLGVSNDNVYKNIGFNVIFKWQDKMFWEGTFGTGDVPAYSSLDAQVSYKLPEIKSMIKLGATNLINKYYLSAFGNPQVGGLYYISFGYNVF